MPELKDMPDQATHGSETEEDQEQLSESVNANGIEHAPINKPTDNGKVTKCTIKHLKGGQELADSISDKEHLNSNEPTDNGNNTKSSKGHLNDKTGAKVPKPSDNEFDAVNHVKEDVDKEANVSEFVADSENVSSNGATKTNGNYEDNSNTNNDTSENTEDKTSLDGTDANEGLPIDRGWAWVILIAAALCYFILIGHMKSFGIIFVQIQERFQSNSAETSLIFTLQNIMYSLTAVFVMTIGSSMSPRTSITFGTLLSSTAYFITAFLRDITPAYFLYGVIIGISNAFIHTQVTTIISVYFEKKRGFANNIANAGVSLGGLVFAPVLTKLFETYAFTGTFMFITGFHFNMLIVACLIRPMSFYKKRQKCKTTVSLPIQDEEEKLLGNQSDTLNNRDMEYEYEIDDQKVKPYKETNILVKRALSKPEHTNGDLNPHVRRRTVSERGLDLQNNDHTKDGFSFLNSKMARFASTDVVNSSLYDLTLIQYDSDMQLNETITAAENRRSKISTIGKSILRLGSKVLDLKLLSKPVFLYFLVCNAFLTAGNALVTAYLPAHAVEMGVDQERVALMVSGTSVLDFASKLLFAPLSDSKWCRRSTLIGITTIITGITSQFLHFMTSFGTICILSAIGGSLQGVYWSLFVVVILDILTFEDFKGAFGFVCLVQGSSASVSLLCSGYLRDYTGYYFLTYNFIGGCLICGGVLMYFLPNVSEWDKRRAKNASKDRTNASKV